MSKEITLTSGKKIQWHRCPRYVLWRHGRTAHTFQRRAQQAAESGVTDPIERGLAMFESLSEHEAIKLMAFADDVIKNSTDVRDPGELDELSYWEIFGFTMYASPDAPIETQDGEATADAVETFPSESVVSTAGESLPDVPGNVASTEDGNSRPVSP